jgi:glyoxylase-like metal-dependent hydrolase (beta-lactamase superfamily II)
MFFIHIMVAKPALLVKLVDLFAFAVAPKLRRHPVKGGDVLTIAGQDILVVSAPGHTDGHLALFHAPSRMLIAGDHCVG